MQLGTATINGQVLVDYVITGDCSVKRGIKFALEQLFFEKELSDRRFLDCSRLLALFADEFETLQGNSQKYYYLISCERCFFSFHFGTANILHRKGGTTVCNLF